MKALFIILPLCLLPLIIWLIMSINNARVGTDQCLTLTGHEQEECMRKVKRELEHAEAVGKAVTGKN